MIENIWLYPNENDFILSGGMYLPKTDGARLIVGSWWLVVMVVVATYSGSLVAFLTFPKMEPAIETVDDLLERRADITWSIPSRS